MAQTRLAVLALVAGLLLASPATTRAGDADLFPPDAAAANLEPLFQNYLAARDEAQRLVQEGASLRQRAADLGAEGRQVQYRYKTQSAPVYSALNEARGKLALCDRVLKAREPAKPVKKTVPKEPGKDADDDAKKRWKAQKERIERENHIAEERYQRDLKAFRQYQKEAREEKPKLQHQIQEAEAQLEQISASRAAEQTPILTEIQQVRTEMNALGVRTTKAVARNRTLADALRKHPEQERLKHGICEWENAFHTLQEIGGMRDNLQAECDNARAEFQARAENAGGALPDDWRPPKQDTLDALNALLARAERAAAL